MEDGNFCIADFGISKYVDRKDNNSTITTRKLVTEKVDAISRPYAAPELLYLWNNQEARDNI